MQAASMCPIDSRALLDAPSLHSLHTPLETRMLQSAKRGGVECEMHILLAKLNCEIQHPRSGALRLAPTCVFKFDTGSRAECTPLLV